MVFCSVVLQVVPMWVAGAFYAAAIPERVCVIVRLCETCA